MPALSQGQSRVTPRRFAVGHEGRLPTLEGKLERLREDAAAARKTFAAHPCHGCEVRKAQAEDALDRFLDQHPGITS